MHTKCKGGLYEMWNVIYEAPGVGDRDLYHRNGLFGLFEERTQSVRVDYMKCGM